MSALSEYLEASGIGLKSPVGSLSERILAESPELSPEEIVQLARNQLLKAAGRKKCRVTTPKQDAASLARFKTEARGTPE